MRDAGFSPTDVIDTVGQEFSLDTDLDHMEGIVDMSAVNLQGGPSVFPHGASLSSSGSGSDGRPGLAGRSDYSSATTLKTDPSMSLGSTTDPGNGRAVVHSANNIPPSPFTRQNPFSTSADSADAFRISSGCISTLTPHQDE